MPPVPVSWIIARASDVKRSRSQPARFEAHANALSAVLEAAILDVDAAMEARLEGAVAAELETVAQLGEADEDERQERAAVPLVIEQDVQMVERVLVQEVAFVEEEDGMDAVASEVLHVRRDRVEDGGGRGGRREAERDTELAGEVASTERDVRQ
jgi:hypothetical protein